MIPFVKTLDRLYPRSQFATHSNKLTGLSNKLKGANGRCINESEFGRFDDFRRYLTNHSVFGTKLRLLDHLCAEIAKAEFFRDIRIVDSSKIVQNMNKYMAISEATAEAMVAMRQNPESILSVTTAMLLFISRRETFYHGNKSLFERGLKTLNLSNFDIDEMCSVTSKIARTNSGGIGYESDVEAIRNAIGHASYEIKKVPNGYLVRFDRHDMGYNFKLEFTGQQFIKYYYDFYLFEVLQSTLLVSNLYQAMMLKFLAKF